MVWGSKSAKVEAKPSTIRRSDPLDPHNTTLLLLLPRSSLLAPHYSLNANRNLLSPAIAPDRQLLPLIIVLVICAGAAFVGYQIYLGVTKIRQDASQKMARKNVVFTKDGMKVGVKHVENEKYVDATQNWVVKAWNMGHDPVKRK
ncbi:hypothetical protein F4778DRAFT_372818 [Xylariomycetidae sp. FL2044]|nr:hypothetical protein F4778DRAFT_372818 [Xylariomycetidae sp. FL2044]